MKFLSFHAVLSLFHFSHSERKEISKEQQFFALLIRSLSNPSSFLSDNNSIVFLFDQKKEFFLFFYLVEKRLICELIICNACFETHLEY